MGWSRYVCVLDWFLPYRDLPGPGAKAMLGRGCAKGLRLDNPNVWSVVAWDGVRDGAEVNDVQSGVKWEGSCEA